MEFRWNDWNIQHIGKHGVIPTEAEEVVSGAERPYPERREDDKWLAWGSTNAGRMLQVVYLLENDGVVFVIHSRPLTPRERRALQRRRP